MTYKSGKGSENKLCSNSWRVPENWFETRVKLNKKITITNKKLLPKYSHSLL